MRVEKKLGGSLLDKPRSLLFQDGGSNLSIAIEELSYGWKSTPQSDQQVDRRRFCEKFALRPVLIVEYILFAGNTVPSYMEFYAEQSTLLVHVGKN